MYQSVAEHRALSEWFTALNIIRQLNCKFQLNLKFFKFKQL